MSPEECREKRIEFSAGSLLWGFPGRGFAVWRSGVSYKHVVCRSENLSIG
jgi:hypothetical protein